jgi:hypothetical protein
MAKTAIDQLQDQIEAIRRESYAAGYAAAMQAIRDFTARPAASPAAAPRRSAAPPAAAPAAPVRRRRTAAKAPTAARSPRGPRAAAQGRPQRGTNARLIAEVLQAMPSGTARPAEIRKALQSDKGVAMAFTSIRHALGQLASRNQVASTDDGKTWRYLGGAS